MWIVNQKKTMAIEVNRVWKRRCRDGNVQIRGARLNEDNKGHLLDVYTQERADEVFEGLTFLVGKAPNFVMEEQ